MLTLPLVGFLKKEIAPNARIVFFGKTYTQDAILAFSNIDEFLNYDDFENLDEAGQVAFLKATGADAIVHVFPRASIASAAKSAEISFRIGTTNRLYHWWTCNKLIQLSRKNSDMHEAQLNIKLLGQPVPPDIKSLSKYYGPTRIPALSGSFRNLFEPGKFHLILHPGSNVSAREWSPLRFRQ